MRRILAITLLLAGLGAFAFLAGGASHQGGENPKYWVELDNAFGLTEGSDFKIAGVRAGQIGTMRVSSRSRGRRGSMSTGGVPSRRTPSPGAFCSQAPPSRKCGSYAIVVKMTGRPLSRATPISCAVLSTSSVRSEPVGNCASVNPRLKSTTTSAGRVPRFTGRPNPARA